MPSANSQSLAQTLIKDDLLAKAKYISFAWNNPSL